jgi:hypothetical protein
VSRFRPIHLIRYGLPAAILLAGVIVILAGTGGVASAAGSFLIGVAVMVYLVNVLARLAIASQRDRDTEQQARDEFARSGRWEVPPARGGHGQGRPAGIGDPNVTASSVHRQPLRRPLGRSQRPRGSRHRSEH